MKHGTAGAAAVWCLSTVASSFFWMSVNIIPLNGAPMHLCAFHATGSQVCNLSWSKNVNEIVSTHGYSQNQVHAAGSGGML